MAKAKADAPKIKFYQKLLLNRHISGITLEEKMAGIWNAENWIKKTQSF